jgi:hypothetical protein
VVKVGAERRGAGGGGEGRGRDAGELLHHGAEVGDVGGQHRRRRATRRARPFPRPPRRRRGRLGLLPRAVVGARRARGRGGGRPGRAGERPRPETRLVRLLLWWRRGPEFLLEAVEGPVEGERAGRGRRRRPEQRRERGRIDAPATAPRIEVVFAAARRLEAAAVTGVHPATHLLPFPVVQLPKTNYPHHRSNHSTRWPQAAKKAGSFFLSPYPQADLGEGRVAAGAADAERGEALRRTGDVV